MTELIKSLPQNILEAGAKMGWQTCLSSWVSIGKHHFACFSAEEWEFCVVCFDWNVGTKGDKEQWKAGGWWRLFLSPPGLTLDPSRLLWGWDPGGVVWPWILLWSATAAVRSTVTADTSTPEQVRSSRNGKRTPWKAGTWQNPTWRPDCRDEDRLCSKYTRGSPWTSHAQLVRKLWPQEGTLHPRN